MRPNRNLPSVRAWSVGPVLAALAAGIVLGVGRASTGGEESADAPAFQLSPDLPHDVFAPIPGATGFQSPMDSLSWQTFVALCWPASPVANGVPDRDYVIGGQPVGGYYPKGMPSSPTVWETYKDSREAITDSSTPPTPFSTKAVHVLSDVTVPFTNSPLVDQNGKPVYYEVRLNETEFDYIVANKLYDPAATHPPVSFPSGSNVTADVGSIHLKAAWKILAGPETAHPDDPARFYTAQAVIQDGATSHPATVALVGLHIAHKTASRPQWIWSTFEQVDNAPNLLPRETPITPGAYSFCNPSCAATACPPNQPVAPGSTTPVQVLRVTPIEPDAAPLNRQWQQALRSWNAKTVWQYYQLVSTQWPAEPANVKGLGMPQPTFLANTTLETFFQGPTVGKPSPQNPPHSCIGCHGMFALRRDFLFQLPRSEGDPALPDKVSDRTR